MTYRNRRSRRSDVSECMQVRKRRLGKGNNKLTFYTRHRSPLVTILRARHRTQPFMNTDPHLGNNICTNKGNWRAAPFPGCGEAQSREGENIMKTTHRLTLIALTTLFVVAVAVLWASTPAKVSAQTRSTFAFGHRSLTGLASPAGPLTFVQGLFQAPWR